VDKAEIKKSAIVCFSRKTSFMQLLRSGFAHKKTPLKKPVALADPRKSSTFKIVIATQQGILVVISPPLNLDRATSSVVQYQRKK
jgi:hypothetical protein